MNHGLWIAKKNQLGTLIKKISDSYGGDDINWLRNYCIDVIEAYREDIQMALDCFLDIESKLKYIPRRIVLHGTLAKEA